MKKGVFAFGFVFVGLMMLSMVSAQGFGGVRDVSDRVITAFVDIFEPILSALFGHNNWGDGLLFERTLVFIVLFSFIFIILGKVPMFDDAKRIKMVVAIIIPLIGMRFMDYAALVAVINQYFILSIILSSILPFVIYFYFVYNIAGNHGVLRKLAWIIFSGIYLGLWSTASVSGAYANIYLWTFVASLAMLFGDNLIMNRIDSIEIYKKEKWRLSSDLAGISREIEQIRKDMKDGHIGDKIGRERIKDLEKQYKWLSKRIVA